MASGSPGILWRLHEEPSTDREDCSQNYAWKPKESVPGRQRQLYLSLEYAILRTNGNPAGDPLYDD
jgi:hypothetical protein